MNTLAEEGQSAGSAINGQSKHADIGPLRTTADPNAEGSTMRAIVIEKFGGVDNLVYKDLPRPAPEAGFVVIEIKAFGINHAEMHMRRGEWAEAAEVSGIECVGLVSSCPGAEFRVGAKVAALMGGLGRTRNGSYAEYTRVPVSNVTYIDSDLPWANLAALPETYATAWTCLHRNLEITKGQKLLIRGATSSFGQTAVKLAINAGACVTATTRNRERFRDLDKLGAALASMIRCASCMLSNPKTSHGFAF